MDELRAKLKLLELKLERIEYLQKREIEDTADIVDWVRSAKRGSKVVGSFLSFCARICILFGKIAIAIAAVWAILNSIQTGKLSDWHWFP